MQDKFVICPVCGAPVTARAEDGAYMLENPLTGDKFELTLDVVNEYLSKVRTITIGEAASRLGKTKQMASHLAHTGKIRSVHANGRVIAVLESDVEEMCKKGK